MRIDTPFDLESFNNFFSAIFLDNGVKSEFVIFEERNELKGLLDYVRRKNICLVGYNSIHYDNVIINYLITYESALSKLTGYQLAASINKLSQAIINFDNEDKKTQKVIKELRYKRYYQFIDVLEVIREGYNVKGLKAVGINLKWHRIQDLPFHYTHIVKPDEVESILDYNFNDVLITDLVLKTIQPRIKMREVLSEKYGVNVLSDADSKIAKTTLDKFYEDLSGEPIEVVQNLRSKRTELRVGDLFFDWVKFETPELNEYYESLKDLVITGILEKGKCDIPELTFAGLTLTLALGGIHSVDKPGIFETDENSMLLDIDVNSHYPNCILNNKVCPEHLNPDIFLQVLQMTVDERITNKKLGKTDEFALILSNGLKISINTLYGLFNYKGYWLYDPKCTYEVTLNNQMSLLMLIEDLHLHDIQVISANTDGLILNTNKDNLDLIRNIYSKWEKQTGFTLEETFYSKYIRRDINNFLNVKTDGEIKIKGIFIPQGGILKGYDKPIIAIALQEYFINNKPVEETIKSHKDIYSFCMAKKIGSTYQRAEFHINDSKEEVQRSLRYYASNSGGELFKVKIKEDGTESIQTLLSSSKVTLFNDYYESDNYDINYQYYIDECNKIICQIENRIFIDRDKIEEKIKKLEDAVSKNQNKYDTFISKQSKSKAVESTLLVLNKQKEQLGELKRLI